MYILQEYVAYLKDNPEGYWFKRKLYGLGWMPATRAGWVTLVFYLAFVFCAILLIPKQINEAGSIIYTLGPVTLATVVLLVVTFFTGEPLKWQWDNKADD